MTRFAGAGAIGFLIDGGILTALHAAGWSALHARLVSMTVAITATWLINRRFALKPARELPRPIEYACYFLIQLAGAALNFGIFALCLHLWPSLSRVPIVPLAVGAAVAMFFNFGASLRTLYSVRDTDSRE